MTVEFQPAASTDAEELVALRIAAMQPSLERIGRFDPQRARDRFLSGFNPTCTWHLVVDEARVGFVVVRPQDGALLLDHLYVAPTHQGVGVGAATLAIVFARADEQQLPVKVGALRGSDSNRFYERYGFQLIETTEWDNYYVRRPDSTHAASDGQRQTMGISLESPTQHDVRRLIEALDAFQTPLYPAESHHGVDADALTGPDAIFAVARDEWGQAVGCGAILIEAPRGELKRFYTSPAFRGKGIARRLLAFLEEQARRRGCAEFLLETGNRQPEAVAFYSRCGYERCGPFGAYTDDPHSVFMRKRARPLRPSSDVG